MGMSTFFLKDIHFVYKNKVLFEFSRNHHAANNLIISVLSMEIIFKYLNHITKRVR